MGRRARKSGNDTEQESERDRVGAGAGQGHPRDSVTVCLTALQAPGSGQASFSVLTTIPPVICCGPTLWRGE